LPPTIELWGELLVAAYATQYARKLPDVVLPSERLADLRDQADKRAHGAVLVAEAKERIIGTVALYRWGSPRSQAWIANAADRRFLAIHVECQGQGLSSALLHQAEQLVRGWDAPASASMSDAAWSGWLAATSGGATSATTSATSITCRRFICRHMP